MRLNALINIRNKIDGILKFPFLNKGDTGVQIGFDLSSANLTSDLWVMALRVGKEGRIIGIDPDPHNHERIEPILKEAGVKTLLVQKGTFNQAGKEQFILKEKASWNKLNRYEDEDKTKSDRKIEVELDTVDRILDGLKVKISHIKHINITNNGAEFATLQGMSRILSEAKNLSLTIVAGRAGNMGRIDGQRDYEAIMELLSLHGFKVGFYRKSQLIWWGMVHNLLLKRRRLTKASNYGVVIATKGEHKRKWYQSYS